MKVLIVEDEIRLADALKEILRGEKYDVDIAHDGEDGLAYAEIGDYDVIVLDIMIPKLSGFEVIKALRQQKISTPTIMLTARDEVTDKIRGLDQGADDYMTKPFVPEELLARIRAMTRRQGDIISNDINYADLTLNLATNTLYCNERSVRLGYKEFEILRLLLLNSTVITSKETLLIKVWGSDSNAEDNNVEAYISFLRKKIQYLGSKVIIETIRKVGYRLGVEE